MKRTMACGGVALAALLAFSGAGPVKDGAAVDPDKVVYDALTAWEFMQKMEGDWDRGRDEHQHGGTSRKVNFRMSAGGSAMVETLYPGEPNEMLSIFHWNGEELLLTHYCALQNAPVMKFVKSDKPGEIKFEFQGGTNFDPKVDQHVHEGTYRVKDKNTVEAVFVTYTSGKAGRGAPSMLRRKEAAK